MKTLTKMSHLNPAISIPDNEDYPDWGSTAKKAKVEAVEKRGNGRSYKYSYLPRPSGKEKLYQVFTTKKSPWKKIDVMGITFDREIFMPMKELGQYPEPAVCIISLADNQLAALNARRKDMEKYHIAEATGEEFHGLVSELTVIKLFPGKTDQSIIPLSRMVELAQEAVESALPETQPKPGSEPENSGSDSSSSKEGGK
ncbi:MAG: hypothetical protein KDD43_07475 [Bdellovibrionales bacterium]|nr:hypothetical protein [Bdellovibrionales bacterium]